MSELRKKIKGFDSYLKRIGESELELDYFIMSYLAEFYFTGLSYSVSNEVTDLISEMITSKDERQVDLVFAGFFESHALEDIHKVKEVYRMLTPDAQKMITSVDDFWDRF